MVYDFKIGDKLIKTRRGYFEVVTVTKINKATFSLSDSSLVYKDGLGVRGGGSYNNSHYRAYTEEQIKELEKSAFDGKVRRCKSLLKSERGYTKAILEALLIKISEEEAKDAN